jgi:O-antigen/teichoic acid export membrane protein
VSAGEKGLLAGNMAVLLVSKGLYLLTRLAVPAVVLRYLPLSEYGVWSLSFVVIGYLGMSTFGISNTYVRYSAELEAGGRRREIGELVSTGMTLSLVILLPLVLAAAAGMRVFGISPGDAGSLSAKGIWVSIWAVSSFLIFDLALGAFAYVLEGLQKMKVRYGIWLGGAVVETALIFLLLKSGWGLWALPAAYFVRTAGTAFASFIACRRALPEVRFRVGGWSREWFRRFLRYGSVVQVSGMLGMVLYSAEKLIASLLIGVHATGLIEIAQKLPVMSSQLAGGMNAAVLPAASDRTARDAGRGVGDLVPGACRKVTLACGLVAGFLFAFSDVVLSAWLGGAYPGAEAAAILSVSTFAYHAHVTTGAGSACIRASDAPSRELVYPALQTLLVVLCVGAAWFSGHQSTFAIVSSVSAAMVFSALIYLVYQARVLSISAGNLIGRGIVPGFAFYALGLSVRVLADKIFGGLDPLFALGAAASLYGFFALPLAYAFFDKDEREMSSSAARRIAGGLRLALGRGV